MNATKFQNLTVGTKVYYKGDMANVDGHGEIKSLNPNDRWNYGVTYNIELDDGRTMRAIHASNFGDAGAYGGHRFELMSEREAARAARLAQYRAAIE